MWPAQKINFFSKNEKLARITENKKQKSQKIFWKDVRADVCTSGVIAIPHTE